ncbi:MAG: STAS domain-containing protein [candidate division KSB1 bacterium]|nr:STAS domain-containing protein [candidate division KSB1 bacterium]
MLEIVTRTQDKVAIIEIKGEVDLYSSPEVRKAILSFTKIKAPALIVDLSRVSYMDSSGVATLVEGLQLTGEYGGQFKLVSPGPTVREVFELSRLDRIFDIYSNLSQALEGSK